jgi:elongator complex protein 1
MPVLIVREPASVRRDTSRTDGSNVSQSSISKVSAICDAILAELLVRYPTTHTQSILTAHLSKVPPDISAALKVIAKLKGTSIRRKLIKDDNSNLVSSAIEHICFLADVNRLYDESLGLYRLDIVLLIAQKSQKV